MSDDIHRAKGTLQGAGYVVLDPVAVAGLHERIARWDACQAPGLEGLAGDSEYLTALVRVVGYLEAYIGRTPPPAEETR